MDGASAEELQLGLKGRGVQRLMTLERNGYAPPWHHVGMQGI